MKIATDGQIEKISALLKEKGYTPPRIQELLETGVLSDLLEANTSRINRGELRDSLGLFRGKSTDIIPSEHDYPANFKMKPVEDQLHYWDSLLSTKSEDPLEHPRLLGYSLSTPLPPGAEGWLVVPSPSAMKTDHRTLLRQMIRYLMDGFQMECALDPYMRGSKMFFREFPETAHWRKKMEESNLINDRFHIIAIQAGKSYRGYAANAAVDRMKFEVPLGLYEAVVFLLSHPERFAGGERELGILCPGTEYRKLSTDNWRFGACPSFFYKNGKLRLDYKWKKYPDERCGIMTAFRC